jgi:pimeloyl-ACP methyl ester carboxylesterase
MAAGLARALAFLARLGLPGGGPAPRPLPVAGAACDWYPARGRPRAAVVALHGLTLEGRAEHRLAAFARALARSGAHCAVPELPGLAGAVWDGTDVEVAGRAIEAAAAEGGMPVAVVGFSQGGSVGLLAAGRPGPAAAVRAAIAFGAHHDLGRVLGRLAGLDEPRPDDGDGWDDWIWVHLVQAHRCGEALGLPAALRAEVEHRLRRHCLTGLSEDKRRFYEERLRPLELLRRGPPPAEGDLRALSPAGRLQGVACPVALLHDPADRLVPASEAEALRAELAGRPAGSARDRLLVTGLLRHVSPAAAFRPAEALRLLAVLAPLLG